MAVDSTWCVILSCRSLCPLDGGMLAAIVVSCRHHLPSSGCHSDGHWPQFNQV